MILWLVMCRPCFLEIIPLLMKSTTILLCIQSEVVAQTERPIAVRCEGWGCLHKAGSVLGREIAGNFRCGGLRRELSLAPEGTCHSEGSEGKRLQQQQRSDTLYSVDGIHNEGG
jgi:hypothetical protein